MAYYRTTFPQATITPKLHLLECHVLPWIRRWKVGFGLMGEQGAESIHARFNSLKRTYQTMPDGVQRLQQIMQMHFLEISPANVPLHIKDQELIALLPSNYSLPCVISNQPCGYSCIPFVGATASGKKVTTDCNLDYYDNQYVLFRVLLTFSPGKLQVFYKLSLFLARVNAC